MRRIFVVLAALIAVSVGRAAPTFSACQSDTDCRLIFDSCSCLAVPAKDPRQVLEIDKKAPRLCKCNECNCHPSQKVRPRCVKNQCQRSDQIPGEK